MGFPETNSHILGNSYMIEVGLRNKWKGDHGGRQLYPNHSGGYGIILVGHFQNHFSRLL
jgi:hypothetical protein